MTEPFRKTLVTGGAGFIGSHLVEQLAADGQDVRVLERPGAPVAHLPGGVEVVFADVGDPAAVRRAAAGCDLVLHLAANPNLWGRSAAEFDRVNHLGTRNVLDAARAAGARRAVVVSSETVLSPPRHDGPTTEQTPTRLEDMLGPYCRSKWLAEQAAREAAAGLHTVIVRPSVVVGPGDHNLTPPGKMIRDFCTGRISGYVDGMLNLVDARDVAAGIRAAADRGEPGAAYLLVAENWHIGDLFRHLAELTGRPPAWRVPYPAALLYARLEEAYNTCVDRRRDWLACVAGVKLTRRLADFDGGWSSGRLGWRPRRDCRESVREEVDWLAAAGFIPAAGREATPVG